MASTEQPWRGTFGSACVRAYASTSPHPFPFRSVSLLPFLCSCSCSSSAFFVSASLRSASLRSASRRLARTRPPGPPGVGPLLGILQQLFHVCRELALVKERRLGLVPERRQVLGRQDRLFSARRAGLRLRLRLWLRLRLFRRRKLVPGQCVPGKKAAELCVPPLQHRHHLLVGPVVHRDAADPRDGHAEAPVLSRAADADQGAVGNGRPLGVPGVAVDAIVVALEAVQEGPAGHGKGFAVGIGIGCVGGIIIIIIVIIIIIICCSCVVEYGAFQHPGQLVVGVFRSARGRRRRRTR
mmetsp:Transcript_2416/g.6483  ORF Transcript_2416/g.6483 Transcript_2416/m.6483 type:complete len:297 (-) Transcript_2416:906-1796(-)